MIKRTASHNITPDKTFFSYEKILSLNGTATTFTFTQGVELTGLQIPKTMAT